MIYHVGSGYAIPNAEDTPYIEELARQEGILLDPVYTGKAWAKFLMLVKEGYFDAARSTSPSSTPAAPRRCLPWSSVDRRGTGSSPLDLPATSSERTSLCLSGLMTDSHTVSSVHPLHRRGTCPDVG